MNKPQPVVASSPEQMLRYAATVARSAPSIFNTQPWRWQINLPLLRLYADRTRQLMVADPDGRLLTISCGAALHHARIAMAVSGCHPHVGRLPDPNDPDLLAEIRMLAGHSISPHEINAFAGMGHRHTDRRAFTDEPIEQTVLDRLTAAAQRESAHLYLLRDDQVSTLASVAAQASALELSDPGYRVELMAWTHRPPWSGDGITADTVVRDMPRRPVPVRDFLTFDPGQAIAAGAGDDGGARFVLIFTDEDTPLAWVHAGEALSAVLLEAASSGLGSAPISDITELAFTRQQLRARLLANLGYPQIAVRIGHRAPGPVAASPRRDLPGAIHIAPSKEDES